RGHRELLLELGYLFSDVPRRGSHLSGDALPRHWLDARNRAQRVVPGARYGIARRRHSHDAQPLAGPAWQRLCGTVSQYPAAGADVLVVLRATRAAADPGRRLA